MTEKEAILDKLSKIQKLVQSPVESEAYAAIATFRKLVAKYSISEDEISYLEEKVREKIVHEVNSGVLYTTRYTPWKVYLALETAKYFRCKVTKGYNWHQPKSYSLGFVGQDSDPEDLAAMFRSLVTYMERCIWVIHDRYINGGTRKFDASTSWALGFVDGLTKTFEKQKQNQESKECSLMCIIPDAVVKYVKEKYDKSDNGPTYNVINSLYKEGYMDGTSYGSKPRIASPGIE